MLHLVSSLLVTIGFGSSQQLLCRYFLATHDSMELGEESAMNAVEREVRARIGGTPLPPVTIWTMWESERERAFSWVFKR